MLRPQKQSARWRGGQALVTFSLAITTICGFLALAVDVGLAYSIRKSAQSAADLAALAGAQQALSLIGTNVYTATACPPAAGCQQTPSTSCGLPHTSIASACLYAASNGFSNSPNNGYAQTVMVAAYTNPSSIYTPGLVTSSSQVLVYWVDVEISEQVPHLFAGVLNSSFLNVQVRAVAAIVQTGTGGNKKSTISLVQ